MKGVMAIRPQNFARLHRLLDELSEYSGFNGFFIDFHILSQALEANAAGLFLFLGQITFHIPATF